MRERVLQTSFQAARRAADRDGLDWKSSEPESASTIDSRFIDNLK
jgi:hypothetical protein